METKVVGYIRVSTKEQGEQGVSLDAQRAKLISYAQLYDLDLVGIEVDTASGKSMNRRPGLKTCLAMIEGGEVDGLLIAKLDRLSRKTLDICQLIDTFFKEHLLISVADHLDTKTPNGRFFVTIMAGFAELERETISLRTVEALQHLKSEGVTLGRSGFGWDHGAEVDDEGRRIIAGNEGEAHVLGVMVSMRKAGRSLRDIVSHLERGEHPTKRGGRWTPATVNRIIKRELRRRERLLAA
jgi:site-specific DNA recombinase